MLFSENKKLEEIIVHCLHREALPGSQLVEVIQARKEPGPTRPAVYHALKKLLAHGVVSKVGKKYYLSKQWIRNIKLFVNAFEDNQLEYMGVTSLRDGDKLSFSFSNPRLMDLYWGQLFDALYSHIDESKVLFLYHPHEWLMLTRQESEKFFFDRCERHGRLHLVTIGGDTELDKEFKKEYSSQFNKINTGMDLGFSSNYYLSIMDDYVFEIKIDKKVAELIDQFYTNHANHLSKLDLEELESLTGNLSKIKLVVTRNKKKASQLKKRLAKDFFVPSRFAI